MLPLLIVRPEPGASRTAAHAAALGLTAHRAPLFAITPLPWVVPDPAAYDALLLTSANGVRHAGSGVAALAGLRCFAVGAATAKAARARGLDPVATGTSDAQTLVDTMTANGARAILWLTGADHSAIAGRTARITPVITYAAPKIAPPPSWSTLIAQPAVVMLHSARAARRVAALAGPRRNHLIALAISEAVAAACGGGWGGCVAAPAPTDADMLALAHKLCQTQAD